MSKLQCNVYEDVENEVLCKNDATSCHIVCEKHDPATRAKELTAKLRVYAIVGTLAGWLCTLCRERWESEPPDGAKRRGEKHKTDCLLHGTTDT